MYVYTQVLITNKQTINRAKLYEYEKHESYKVDALTKQIYLMYGCAKSLNIGKQ